MRTKKRTRIRVETGRVLVMGRPDVALDGWCPSCDQLVRLIRPEEAATMAACIRARFQPLELARLHLVGTPEGLMYVCLNSLVSQG